MARALPAVAPFAPERSAAERPSGVQIRFAAMLGHIVHVGYHKTGSTWLQRYVLPTVTGATPIPRNRLMGALWQNLTDAPEFLGGTFRAALDELGGGDRLVLSHEALVGRPWGPNQADRTADRVAAIVPDSQIVVVLRDQRDLVRSLHAQYVSEGGYLNVNGFMDQVLNRDYLDFEASIARMDSRFRDVLILEHEALRENPRSFVQEIADFANVELSISPEAQPANVSLGGWRLGLLRAWNRLFRESQHNTDPMMAVPHAGVMRSILQRR